MATFVNFPGKDINWLKAKLDDILEAEAAGQANTEGGSGDVNFRNQVQTTLEATKRKLLWDLYQLDPITYPKAIVSAPTLVRGVFRSVY